MPSATIIGSAGHSAITELINQIYRDENSAYILFRDQMWDKSKEKALAVDTFKLTGAAMAIVLVGSILSAVTSPTVAVLGIFMAILVLLYIGYRRSGSKRIQRFQELMSSPQAPSEFPRSEIDSRVRQELSKLRSTKPFDESWLIRRARSWTLGALGELRTGDILSDSSDDLTVAHDLMLLQKDGTTKANIDHVVFSDRFTIMIDTKWWSKAPQVSGLPTGGYRVLSPSHAKSIKTCLWEAAESNLAPELIIIAVGRTGGEQVDEYDGGLIPAEEFVDDYSGDVTSVAGPPVLFLPQERLAMFIAELKETPKFWVTHATQPHDVLTQENGLLPSIDPRVDLIQDVTEGRGGRPNLASSAS